MVTRRYLLPLFVSIMCGISLASAFHARETIVRLEFIRKDLLIMSSDIASLESACGIMWTRQDDLLDLYGALRHDLYTEWTKGIRPVK